MTIDDITSVFTSDRDSYTQWCKQFSNMVRMGCGLTHMYPVLDTFVRNNPTTYAKFKDDNIGSAKYILLMELLDYYMNEMVETYGGKVSSGAGAGLGMRNFVDEYNSLAASSATKERNTNKAHTFAVAYGDNNPIVEETKMSNTINSLKDTAVTSVHVVFGTVITSDTPDSFFIDLMRKLKGDIDALADVLDSNKMKANSLELIANRQAIVKLFDSRT